LRPRTCGQPIVLALNSLHLGDTSMDRRSVLKKSLTAGAGAALAAPAFL